MFDKLLRKFDNSIPRMLNLKNFVHIIVFIYNKNTILWKQNKNICESRRQIFDILQRQFDNSRQLQYINCILSCTYTTKNSYWNPTSRQKNSFIFFDNTLWYFDNFWSFIFKPEIVYYLNKPNISYRKSKITTKTRYRIVCRWHAWTYR